MNPMYGLSIGDSNDELRPMSPIVLEEDMQAITKAYNNSAKTTISRGTIFRNKMHRRRDERMVAEKNEKKTPYRLSR